MALERTTVRLSSSSETAELGSVVFTGRHFQTRETPVLRLVQPRFTSSTGRAFIAELL